MSKAVVNGHTVHYEVYGSGDKTLLVLNGIMMSTKSWQPFIPFLEKRLRVVLMDFFDQGQSAYLNDSYTQAIQVEAVVSVLDALAIERTSVLGISYGGEVAMHLAEHHGARIDRLILANTTAYTNDQLKAIGDNWVDAARTHDGKRFFKATIPPIYSWGFYEANSTWLREREALFAEAFDAKWYEGFIRLVESAETHDARAALPNFKMPVLVIGAEEDIITPVAFQKALYEAIPKATYLVLPDCGHASMYEQPHAFTAAVLGFLEAGGADFNIV